MLKFKELETKNFLENIFCDGEIKTSGTDIDKLMPPVSWFDDGARAEEKQTVINKVNGVSERDLCIYADIFGGQLYHYQNYRDQEIDAVIELTDGQWCAFEVKLEANQVDAACRWPDGIFVVQVTALKN